jgi:hypothetical protein
MWIVAGARAGSPAKDWSDAVCCDANVPVSV